MIAVIVAITALFAPVSGTAVAAMPTCVLLGPLMAGQESTWAAMPCWYSGDADTPAFIIDSNPVRDV